MTLKVMKLVACSALVAVLAGCGNGDYNAPKVADDAVAVVAFGDVQKGKLAPVFKKTGVSPDVLLQQAPKDVKEMLAKAGLEKIEPQWTVLSVGGDMKGIIAGNVPNIAFVTSFQHDLSRIISVLEEEAKKSGDAQIKKVAVSGVDAWEIYCDEFKTDGKKVVPCIASLDGKLLLVASSASVMEQQIALYRDGKGKNYTMTSDDLLKVSLAKVGASIRESLGDNLEMLQMVNEFVPDGDKMLLGVGTVQASLSAVSDAECRLNIALNTASEEDADKIRTLAKTGLMTLTAQLKKEAASGDSEDKAVLDAVEKAKIGGEKSACELSLNVSAESVLSALFKD